MENIKWIFFDIGSTLVDESEAYEHRIKDNIINKNTTYERFYATMIEFAKQGKNGYIEAANHFGLEKTTWHSEDKFLYPETIHTLELLSENYKIGIIANQLPGVEQRLCDMGIHKFIDLIISSAEEGISKPDIAIFQRALDRAGCNAANAVMIGDRIDNDIVPAKIIGMRTVWIKQGLGGMATPKSEDEVADWNVSDLEEVFELFKGH